MTSLRLELEESFSKLEDLYLHQSKEAFDTLSTEKDIFLVAYMKVSTLQAWRTQVIENKYSNEVSAFFVEAQNDALLSVILARQGFWRPALQSLRSCLENIFVSIYYFDHPVELELWQQDKHRIGFSELVTYIEKHPWIKNSQYKNKSIEIAKNEYKELSRAVHGSSVNFRMTSHDQKSEIWSPRRDKLGAWKTRLSKTIESINLLLVMRFIEELKGTRNRELRSSISLTIVKKDQQSLKIEYGITLLESKKA